MANGPEPRESSDPAGEPESEPESDAPVGTLSAPPAVTVTVVTAVTVAVVVEAGGQELSPATLPRGGLVDGEFTSSPLELAPEPDGPLAELGLVPEGPPPELVLGIEVESVSEAGEPLPEGEPEPELESGLEPKPEPDPEPLDDSTSVPVAPEPLSELLPVSGFWPGVKPRPVKAGTAPCSGAEPPEPISPAAGVDGHIT